LRDGRWIGTAGWFSVASSWCIDLWRPIDDMGLDEVLGNIFPIVSEERGGITREHLVDDYVVSRNVARYGLKYDTVDRVMREMGYDGSSYFLRHVYNVTSQRKLEFMKRSLYEWGLPVEFSDNDYPYYIDGWMTSDEYFWLRDRAREMSNVVEVGSYKGLSTHALLTGCRGLVYAIDIWDKSDEKGPILDQFKMNVGHFPNLHAIQMDSLNAVAMIPDKSVDMVFIDGNHNEEAVEADIKAWLPKTRKLLCGHDYTDPNWPGVKRAVDRLLPNAVNVVGSIWAYNVR